MRSRPETLDEIQNLLSALEGWRKIRIPIHAVLLHIDGEPPFRPGPLTEAQWRMLLDQKAGIRVAASFRGSLFPGERAVLGHVAEEVYLADYEVEVAQKARIADPQTSILRTGVLVEARAHLLNSGRVALDLASSIVEPHIPMRRCEVHYVMRAY